MARAEANLMRELRPEVRPLLDKTTLQKIIKPVFNAASVINTRFFTDGIVNLNLEICLKNPSVLLNLRIFSGDNAGIRARKESIIYGLVADQTSVPVPRVFRLDSSRTVIDDVFVLQSRIPGINLEKVCDQLSSDEQRKIAHQVGNFLGQLHSICFNQFGGSVSGHEIGNTRSWDEFFLDFTSKNIIWCKKQDVIDNRLANSFKEHIVKWQWLLSTDQPAVLVHKDFHLGNIKVQKDQKGDWKVSGVYDFEDAIAGHNEFDFAKPYWAIFEKYPQMKMPMLQNYCEVNSLSPLFEQRMDKLYRLAEITDFLVFGTQHNMVEEVQRNIVLAKKIIGETI